MGAAVAATTAAKRVVMKRTIVEPPAGRHESWLTRLSIVRRRRGTFYRCFGARETSHRRFGLRTDKAREGGKDVCQRRSTPALVDCALVITAKGSVSGVRTGSSTRPRSAASSTATGSTPSTETARELVGAVGVT